MSFSARTKNTTRAVFIALPMVFASAASVVAAPLLAAPIIVLSAVWVQRSHPNPEKQGFDRAYAVEEVVNDIAKGMGLNRHIKVYDKETKGTVAFHDTIFESSVYSDNLSQKAMNFLRAHEVGHIVRRDTLPGFVRHLSSHFSNAALFLSGSLFALSKATTTLSSFEDMSLKASILFGIGKTLSFAVNRFADRYSSETHHAAEFDCDRRAVLHWGEKDGALEAFQSLNDIYRVGWNKAEYTHPSLAARDKAIRALAISA